MKKEVILSLIILIGLVLNFSSISASFEIGNISHSIQEQYGPSENIKGWINISLSHESVDSIFNGSGENKISLIDLLKTSSNYNLVYECTPLDCQSNYEVSNPETTKSFSLESGNSKLIGLKFSEKISSIDSIQFSVQSNAQQSCFNQLKIDVLSDGAIEFGNNKSSSTDCSLKNYGCFNQAKDTNEYKIEQGPNKKHCQKIKLSESPGFKIGAFVNRGGDARDLTMTLYDLNGNEIENANCQLPPTEGEIFCEINHLITKEEDYYVCIYSDEQGTSKIKGYSDNEEGCGFLYTGFGFGDDDASFKIFAQGKAFGALENLQVLNSLPNGNTIAQDVKDYIVNKYGSIDCSRGCVVPIEFISRQNQDIVIKDLEISYTTSAGSTVSNKFFDIIKTPATIDSGYLKINLDGGNFTTPSSYSNTTFRLELNNTKVFSEKISIEKIPLIKSLTPLTTASAFPTQFKANVDSSYNITKYEWDFGNSDTQTTNSNKVTYTYNSTGNYKLTLTATDTNQKKSSKIFDISVNTPEKEINQTLNKKLNDLSSIKEQINNFDQFYQDSINSILNLDEINENIKDIQREYKTASTEAEYNSIMSDLLGLDVPESIEKTISANSITFLLNKYSINLDVLKSIGGGSYDSDKEEVYLDAILLWNQQNLNTKISFSEISAKYENYEEPLLNFFSISLDKKDDSAADSFFIMEEVENLNFNNEDSKEEAGYFYIELTEDEKTIAFSTTEEISFSDLPLFISPELSELTLICIDCGPPKVPNHTLVIFIIIFLIIVAIGVYIFLQQWYKYKYEKHLFNSQNQLYNLVTYIQSEKDKGLKEDEIRNKLKKSGWTSEQITYVLKKYVGKRTGMIEIPIDKIKNMFKKKKNKEKDYRTHYRGGIQDNRWK